MGVYHGIPNLWTRQHQASKYGARQGQASKYRNTHDQATQSNTVPRSKQNATPNNLNEKELGVEIANGHGWQTRIVIMGSCKVVVELRKIFIMGECIQDSLTTYLLLIIKLKGTDTQQSDRNRALKWLDGQVQDAYAFR